MTQYYRGNHFKKKHTSKFILLNFIFLLAIILFAVFGVIQTGKIASYSFGLKSLQEQIRQIEATNQLMEIKRNRYQSMTNLGALIDANAMVKIASADYIVSVESLMATR